MTLLICTERVTPTLEITAVPVAEVSVVIDPVDIPIVAAGNIGQPGPDGPQGPIGLQGPMGPEGVQGTPGAPGSVWYSGAGAPAGSLGVIGDWYLNTTNGVTFEKTLVNSWTIRTSLKGPTGAAGADGALGPQGVKGDPGAAGTPGAAGAAGAQGPQGVKGDTGDVGPQGPQGVQGVQGPASMFDLARMGKVGSWIPSFIWTNVTPQGLQGRLLLARCAIPFAFSEASIEVVGITAAATAMFGVYNVDADGWPTTRAARETALIDCAVAGLKSIPLTAQCPAGVYWMGALLLQNGPTFRATTQAVYTTPSNAQALPTGITQVGWQYFGADLPATLVGVGISVAAAVPVSWVRRAV